MYEQLTPRKIMPPYIANGQLELQCITQTYHAPTNRKSHNRLHIQAAQHHRPLTGSVLYRLVKGTRVWSSWPRSLWPPCVADADIIFLPCGFFLSSIFFYSLISAAADWMSSILRLSANLESRSEMCYKWLAGNTGRNKIAICVPSHNFVGLYLCN